MPQPSTTSSRVPVEWHPVPASLSGWHEFPLVLLRPPASPNPHPHSCFLGLPPPPNPWPAPKPRAQGQLVEDPKLKQYPGEHRLGGQKVAESTSLDLPEQGLALPVVTTGHREAR